MSEFTAIRAISQTIRELLDQEITDPGVTISLKSPREMQQDGDLGISVWLYRVTRNEHLLNNPPQRVAVNQMAHQAIPVNLHYLMTPLMTEPVDEQMLLGRLLQIFNDHPTLRGPDLQDALQGSADEFRVTLENLTLEELARIWGALQESYQTSLTYLVQVVRIDSARDHELAPPVQLRETSYSQILASG